MEKCEPITTEPVNPPPYDSKKEDEGKNETDPNQHGVIEGVNVVQQSSQNQAVVTMVPQAMIAHPHQATTQTGLCECDGPWWGFCCLSLWFLGIGGLVADFKLHGSGTWHGWGLAIIGLLRWACIIMLIFRLWLISSIGMVKKKICAENFSYFILQC